MAVLFATVTTWPTGYDRIMRVVWAIAAGAVTAVALGAVTYFGTAFAEPDSEADSSRPGLRRAWLDGRADAQHDLARGAPRIRGYFNSSAAINDDGIGIDRGTGLPFASRMLSCGTGVDSEAYGAEHDAYNAYIRAASVRGDLAGYDLNYKVRTAEQLRALFAAEKPTRLVRPGDTLATTSGEHVLVYDHSTYGNDQRSTSIYLFLRDVSGDSRTGEFDDVRRLSLNYVMSFRGRAELYWSTYAEGPLDIWIADNETTAIVRDQYKCVWIVDLDRASIVQVIGPVD